MPRTFKIKKSISNSIPNRACGCKGKGPHSEKICTLGEEKTMPRTFKINKATSKKKPTIKVSNGIQLGRKAKPSKEEYPEGFRGITESGEAYVVMVQVSNNDNTVRYEEVGDTDVTVDDDWTVLIPKLWLEAANEEVEAILVTVQPLPEEMYEELGLE